MSEVAHANALRGAEFKKHLGQPKTWIIIGICSALMGLTGAVIEPVVALALFVITLLAGILVTFIVADGRAAKTFYAAYAESRGLTMWSTKSLGGSTPLLRKGDKQRVEVIFEGELAPGSEGQLALWSFIVESRGGKGNKSETHYRFTLVLLSVPESTQHLKDLRAQRQSGFKALEKFEDAFRRSHERVTLESETMHDKYEIFRGKQEDEIWVRRLFSPSFIVWLSEVPPKKFGFELENGWLCAYVPKYRDSAEGLDEMVRIGTTVAARVREEVSQSSPTETEREITQ